MPSLSPVLRAAVLTLGVACVARDESRPATSQAEAVADDEDGPWRVAGSHLAWRVCDRFEGEGALCTLVDDLDDREVDVDALATTAGGHWIVVAGGQVHTSPGFPAAPRSAAAELLGGGEAIVAIDVGRDGAWVVAGSTSWRHGGDLPAGMAGTVDGYYQRRGAIRDLDLAGPGFIVVGDGDHVDAHGIDAELAAVLDDRRASHRTIEVVDVGFDGRWVVVADQEPATMGVSSRLADRLRASAGRARRTSRLLLGPGDDYVVYSHGRVRPRVARPAGVIDRLEDAVGPGHDPIWRRLAAARVPGLSIAVIEDHRVVAARGYGVLRAGQQRPVLASTPFDLASLSKLLGALTIVRLAELGIVELDADVLASPGPAVAEWRRRGEAADGPTRYGVPATKLPAGMTLRGLLTHTAGIRAEGSSPGVPSAFAVLLPLPIVEQLLGFTCDLGVPTCRYTRSKYVWSDRAPGGPPRYASGNFLLAEAVVRDATRAGGADTLHRVLVESLGLRDTSGATPLPAELERRAAWQHGQDGARSTRTLYPWTFAGGVYGSAADYARIMVLALDGGRDDRGVPRLGGAAIEDLLTPVQGRGLGLVLDGDAREGRGGAFFHEGQHDGQARTKMCGNPTTGDGIVVLASADSPDGDDVVGRLLDDVIQTYVETQWQDDWSPTTDCH